VLAQDRDPFENRESPEPPGSLPGGFRLISPVNASVITFRRRKQVTKKVYSILSRFGTPSSHLEETIFRF
jgi:hypothetical protein